MATTTEFKSQFSVEKPIPLYINGEQKVTKATVEVISPLTHKPLHVASAVTTEAEVEEAIAAAADALPSWSATKPAVRRDILLRASAMLEARKDEMWYYCHNEYGAHELYHAADYGDAVEHMKSVAGWLGWALAGSQPIPGEEGRSALSLLEPYGVVAGFAPWNAPSTLGSRAFLAPIAMGNTVVLRGSESTPGVYWVLADTLHKAGLPKGVLNMIYHRPENAAMVANVLVSSPSVKKINYTGSTLVGTSIATLAGKYLKPVLMELGGKAPAIVCEDADLKLAALNCALGSFFNAGQVCMSTERIIVHKNVVEPFREILKATIDQIFVSEDDSFVQMRPGNIEKVRKWLEEAVAAGAKTVYGDIKAVIGDLPTRMRPVMIENVTADMAIYHNESFAPTVSIFVVSSDEEAVKIANDTEYGLSSAVFTEDLRRGLKIAKQIETGAVHINSMTIHHEAPVLPHGGAKKSGWGRFLGPEGLKEWVRIKTVTWRD